MQYQGYCDDFGPLNMASIVLFIKELDKELSLYPNSKILFCVEDGSRNLTNAIFLVGAYMILKENLTPKQVADNFSNLDDSLLEPYRDATFSRPDFGLRLLDCWQGLSKGQLQKWVRYSVSDVWGSINIRHYQHYDDPGNGDLQEVVPGKFVAFKGPVDLRGREFLDKASGARLFSPSYYAEVFREMGVSTVVRLNEPRYDAEEFTGCGIEHFDLEFEDCTCPPDDIVAAFFRIVDAAPGAIAVHCHAGLGRTGTLIALYLMRSHRFTAREAIGWLRIMRPGSVIGEQQHYLEAVDRILRAARRAGAAGRNTPGSGPGDAGPPQPRLARSQSLPDSASAAVQPAGHAAAAGPRFKDPAVLAAQVKAGILRRSSSFSGALPS